MYVCVCVNEGGTNHNRHMYRLEILHKDLDISPSDNSSPDIPLYIPPPG